MLPCVCVRGVTVCVCEVREVLPCVCERGVREVLPCVCVCVRGVTMCVCVRGVTMCV